MQVEAAGPAGHRVLSEDEREMAGAGRSEHGLGADKGAWLRVDCRVAPAWNPRKDVPVARPARSRRLAVLGLAATVGAACVAVVSHQNAWTPTAAAQRTALLQSQVSALRAHDLAKAMTVAAPMLASAAPVVPAAQAPTSSTAGQVAAVDSKLATPAAQVSSVIKGVQEKQERGATDHVAPPTPQPVKLDKHTQKSLESEIRALRHAQEARELKFMKEAAVATANEIARDKANEEAKERLAHQRHVSAVEEHKILVLEHAVQAKREREERARSVRPGHRRGDEPGHAHSTSDEVEDVLRKAIAESARQKATAQTPAQKAAAVAVAKLVKPKPLTPGQRKALKAKESEEAKLRAEEHAKETALAKKFEQHNDEQADNIQSRAPRVVERAVAVKKARRKPKLSAKEEEKLALEKEVERMMKHTDKAVKEKEYEERVQHAKDLLRKEIVAAKAKLVAEAAANKRRAEASLKERPGNQTKSEGDGVVDGPNSKPVLPAAMASPNRPAAVTSVKHRAAAVREKAADGGGSGGGWTKATTLRKQLASFSQVEGKKVAAQKEKRALEKKIAALKSLLHKESSEAKRLGRHLKSNNARLAKEKGAAPAPVPAATKPPRGKTLVAATARGKATGQANSVAPQGRAAPMQRHDAFGGATDHTSASALKRATAVANKVMAAWAEHREAQLKQEHPERYAEEHEKRVAAESLRDSGAIVKAAEEEHAAGLGGRQGEDEAQAFDAFA